MKHPIEVMRSLYKVLDSNFDDKLKELGQWEELGKGTVERKAVDSRLSGRYRRYLSSGRRDTRRYKH